jgi:hypothetical protein
MEPQGTTRVIASTMQSQAACVSTAARLSHLVLRDLEMTQTNRYLKN